MKGKRKRTANPLWVVTEVGLWFFALYFGFDVGRTEAMGWLRDTLPAALSLGLLTSPWSIFLSDIRDLVAKRVLQEAANQRARLK